MIRCIRSTKECLGRGCQDLYIKGKIDLCCREEMIEEHHIVLNIIDSINDFSKNRVSIQRVSSRLSFGANVINSIENEEFAEVLNIVKRFSLLMYEFQDKIIHDTTIGELTHSFINELKKWFSHSFLDDADSLNHPVALQSIVSDINTIEMALGIYMIEEYNDSSLDELFF